MISERKNSEHLGKEFGFATDFEEANLACKSSGISDIIFRRGEKLIKNGLEHGFL